MAGKRPFSSPLRDMGWEKGGLHYADAQSFLNYLKDRGLLKDEINGLIKTANNWAEHRPDLYLTWKTLDRLKGSK